MLLSGFTFERNYMSRTNSKLQKLDIVAEINKMLPSYEAEYLFWLYSKECLSYEPCDNSFNELKEKTVNFPKEVTERTAKQWLLDETVQKASKLLLARVNVQQMNELHQLYVERSKSDNNALKQLLDLNKVLFANDSDSEIARILNDIEVD